MNPAYQALELEFVISKVCMALAGNANWFVMRAHTSSRLLKGIVGTQYR